MINRHSDRPSSTLVLNVALLFALAAVFGIYARAEQAIDHIIEERQTALALAEELRRSSDDLTGMVRTYVVTGNPIFKDYYHEILDIRDGKRPRPERDRSIYWDLVMAGRMPPLTATGQSIALLELIRRTGITAAEFHTLEAAKASSDRLTATELAAMDLLETAGPDREADRAQARLMLFDDRYLQAKADIMRSIHGFTAALDQRTRAAIQAAEAHAIRLRGIFIALGLGLLFMLWRIYWSQRAIAEQLRQREEHLRLIIDGAKVGIFEHDVATNQAVWSERFRAQFGLPANVEPIFANFLSALHPDDRDRVEGLVLRSIENHADYVAEYRVIRPDGSRRWISALGRVFLGDTGHPKRLGGVTIDITDRKEGEEMLLASEQRYRALSANLEREVEARTTEVREAYQALRQSEERYRLLADNTRDVIWTMALDGRITYVSPAVTQVRGLSPEEAMRQPLAEILTPDSLAVVLDYFGRLQAAVQAGRPPDSFRGEVEYWRQDGTTLWTEVTALPILAPDGACVEILGLTRDISLRKAAEDMAKANEARMRRMLDHIPTAIAAVALGADGEILFINEQFVRTFGYTREDIPTLRTWEERAYPDADDRARATTWWQQAVAQAERLQGTLDSPEVLITCKDGRVLDAMVSATIMDDLLLVSFLDVTARRAAEEQLRISEERHRLWADNSLDIVWTMRLDGTFTYMSPSVERIVGYTPQEFMRLSFAEMFTPASYAIVVDGLARAQANVQAGRPIDFTAKEIEQRHKDGSIVWVEITATGMYDRQGRFLEILGITRDISARKQNECELERAREATAAANQALQAANAELHTLASTDALTGVWNRRHFEQAADAAMAQAGRYGDPLSLILFDIDYFKSINDRFGHHTGDLVLIEVARRVGLSLRAADVLARWGGEEFMVLVPHCGEREAITLAEKLRGQIADDAFPGVGRVTSSFGVAEWAPAETLDTWTQRVDEALYQAKDGGRNRVVVGAVREPARSAGGLNLIWRESDACGESAIDDEHRELFRLANRLLRLAMAEPATATLVEAWDTLLTSVVEHFAHEEAILLDRGYPELERHRALHRHLIRRAQELRKQIETGGCDFGRLVDFLSRDVVARHLLEADRAYFSLFAGQQTGQHQAPQ